MSHDVRQSGRQHWLFSLGLAVSALVVLSIDMPIARWCVGGHIPDPLQKALHLSEVFGHGFGVVLILISMAILDPARRWAIPRLTLASLGAGLVANVGKLVVARLRPHHADLDGNVWATFLHAWPLGRGESFEQGCPSSHTATAFGLALGLGWLYPKAQWWFGCLATMVALQRLESGAHFLSDTMWGAAIGVAIGSVAMQMPSLGYLGNKLERWLRLQSPPQASDSVRTCAMASSISGTAAPRTLP